MVERENGTKVEVFESVLDLNSVDGLSELRRGGLNPVRNRSLSASKPVELARRKFWICRELTTLESVAVIDIRSWDRYIINEDCRLFNRVASLLNSSSKALMSLLLLR